MAGQVISDQPCCLHGIASETAMTTMLLLLSIALIGTGVGLVWRDLHSKRRNTFVLSRDSKGDTETGSGVEITVSRADPVSVAGHAEAGVPTPRLTLAGQLLSLARGKASASNVPGDDALPRADATPPS